MRVTKKKIMGFLMTVLWALSAPLVYADQSSPQQGDHEWKQDHHREGRFFHKLNLTDDQKKQLQDIGQKQREARKAVFEQMKANREALTNELLQTTPNVLKINDLKSKLEALVSQMLDNRVNSDLEVKKILTPEQFGKYLELQKKMFASRFHKGRRHCRYHHRHHHGYWGDRHDGNYNNND